MKPFLLLANMALLCTLLLASCSKEEETASGFSFNITDDIILTWEEGAQNTVSFQSASDWQAALSADWLTATPMEGPAGANVITLKATSENDTDESRTATLTLTSNGAKQTINVRQETSDYIRLEQPFYLVDSEGGEIEVNFSTAIRSDKLHILGNGSWINQKTKSRSLNDYSVTLEIAPNPEVKSRIGFMYIVKEENQEQQILTTVTIVQEGNTGSESTDFSADGNVKTLQESNKGKGIPIVLMGDGFIDTEISNGTYDKAMEKTYENLFAEEPMKSLKDYFDVYSVTAVSKSNIFGYGYETAFSCILAEEGSTLITGDNVAVVSYTHCVENIDHDNALAIVILNADKYAGTTYFGFMNPSNQKMTEFAIAYCPMVENAETDIFRQVLTHEAIGHGFAKLEDEYAYEDNGEIPEDEATTIRNLQSSYGWAQNVDFTQDTKKILWRKFLTDERYADEGLGIYEGGCTYTKGIYRPTENSMMNDNAAGFNAPSRKAIYDRVMKEGTGNAPTYESFVDFDRQTSQVQKTRCPASPRKNKPLARPRFVGNHHF